MSAWSYRPGAARPGVGSGPAPAGVHCPTARCRPPQHVPVSTGLVMQDLPKRGGTRGGGPCVPGRLSSAPRGRAVPRPARAQSPTASCSALRTRPSRPPPGWPCARASCCHAARRPPSRAAPRRHRLRHSEASGSRSPSAPCACQTRPAAVPPLPSEHHPISGRDKLGRAAIAAIWSFQEVTHFRRMYAPCRHHIPRLQVTNHQSGQRPVLEVECGVRTPGNADGVHSLARRGQTVTGGG